MATHPDVAEAGEPDESERALQGRNIDVEASPDAGDYEDDNGDQAADGRSADGEGSGDRGYDPVGTARADREVMAEGVRLVTAELGRLSLELSRQGAGGGDELQLAARVMAGVTQIRQIADEMLSRGAGQDPALATAAMATAGVVKGDVKSARKRWPSTVWDRVWDEIKAISRRLWSMVAHLVKVKEWTVQGQAGTGIFGLGSASVSVTFGS